MLGHCPRGLASPGTPGKLSAGWRAQLRAHTKHVASSVPWWVLPSPATLFRAFWGVLWDGWRGRSPQGAGTRQGRVAGKDEPAGQAEGSGRRQESWSIEGRAQTF